MSNCMHTLHYLTNIIREQEVLNIVNITNLVPRGLVNKNQSTDKCTILCLNSTRKCFAIDGEHWFRGRRWGRSNLNTSLVKAVPGKRCTPSYQ